MRVHRPPRLSPLPFAGYHLQTMTNRRTFLQTAATALLTAPSLHAQDAPPDWGNPVIDIHCHLRPSIDRNITHNQGCGVSHALLLTRDSDAERARDAQAKMPGKFRWSV